jgi:hypothetical protein
MRATIQHAIRFSGFIVIGIAASTSACMVDPHQAGGVVTSSDHALLGHNGLHLNNGLHVEPGLALEDGTSLSHGLAVGHGLNLTYGLASEAGFSSTTGFITSEAGQTLLRYMVECALPLGASITKADPVGGGTITFQGLVGLAPEWEAGACDQDCQQWVTACLLARNNALGETVSIEMVASHPAVGVARAQPGSYIYEEAGFYGNLFIDPPVMYSCQGTQVVEASHHGRVCGLDAWESCGFENVVGACSGVNSCAGKSADAYLGCRDEVGASYHTITTFTMAQ